MTATWDRFLAQFHAEGQEKAEGYSEAHFVGLTLAERARAAELLRRELPGSPSAAARGLVLLGDAFAVRALRRFVDEYEGEAVDNIDHAYFALWRLTEDLTWQAKMIEAYPLAWDIARAGFVIRLCETPRTPEARAFLEHCAAEEPDRAARALAGQELLTAAGEEHDAGMAVFRGDQAEPRRLLVKQLAARPDRG